MTRFGFIILRDKYLIVEKNEYTLHFFFLKSNLRSELIKNKYLFSEKSTHLPSLCPSYSWKDVHLDLDLRKLGGSKLLQCVTRRCILISCSLEESESIGRWGYLCILTIQYSVHVFSSGIN